MSDTFYKVLATDGAAFHGGSGKWPLPTGKRPGKWLKIDGKLVPCQNGLHVCRAEHLFTWLGPTIYEVEVRGELIEAGDKVVVAEARLLRELNWNDRTARLFACDCATRALNRCKKRGLTVDGRSLEAVRVARRFAEGKATSEELAAARAAARAAAWAAAWAAARDAAWAAARAAAWAAAGGTKGGYKRKYVAELRQSALRLLDDMIELSAVPT